MIRCKACKEFRQHEDLNLLKVCARGKNGGLDQHFAYCFDKKKCRDIAVEVVRGEVEETAMFLVNEGD